MIEIKNLRNGGYEGKPWQVRCDRGTPLGNPYRMASEKGRLRVCRQYRMWLWSRIKAGATSSTLELEHLHRVYRRYKKLELWCWCAPAKCHCETIKRYVEALVGI